MQNLIWRRACAMWVAVIFCCVFLSEGAGFAEPLAKIVVEAGDYVRIDTPVCASLAGVPLGLPDGQYRLVEVRDAERLDVPVQLEAGSPPRLWWILSGKTEAGAKRTYEILTGGERSAAGVTVEKDEKTLLIKQGSTKVLCYNHAVVPAPEGKSELFNRSGFIHPLWSPKGAVLTDIHPADHTHHLGIWMPWTMTHFEGQKVDFWNLGDGTGTVWFKRFVSTTNGPVYGGFEAEHDHVALKTSAGERVILKEVWDVRVYNIGGPEKGYWLWDFASTQRCVADSSLVQDEYRYGGFGFRGARQWKGENGTYLTSEGKTRVDGHATRARWCDTSGKIDDWEGVTFYSHPENFRHPEPMRIWPEPDNYVFFNFAPSQLGSWEMRPGEDHLFRYRVYVHEGKVDPARTEQVWNDYAHPPKVTVESVQAGKATMLFDGTDFAQWTTGGDKLVGWRLVDGAMQMVPGSGNIMTNQSYGDFKLHVEFKTPQMPANVKGQGRGNSGVYIQRRYELQILDSYGLEPKNNECGAIYTFKAPDQNVCLPPGRWQSYDIVFHAARFDAGKKVKNARITVWHNGVLVHNDVEVANKTGAGQVEGPEPEPVLLQEHGNEVAFRNIWIEPL